MGFSLFRALLGVSFFTFLSRILGFIRDLVFAHQFGASAVTDAFFVAFKIPNFMRRLFAEGAFASAFIPVLTEIKNNQDKATLHDFINQVTTRLALILLAITLIGVTASPFLVMIFAPGFSQNQAQSLLASDMLKLTFPYLFFISLTALSGSILNTHKRFYISAFTPVLLNVVLISCALWLSPLMNQPIMALAWGVFIAGGVQLLFQIPFLRQLELFPQFAYKKDNKGVKKVIRLMIPALFGVSVTQLNLLLDTLLASFLVSGSISWLYYSDRLMEFPLGILGVALTTIVLPTLSGHHSTKSPEAFSKTLDWALRWVILLGLPSAVGLFLLAGPMVSTLFQSEVFTPHSVALASYSLMAYSLGLLFFMSIKVLAPAFYAQQDTKTPVKIAIIAMVANMIFNLLLIIPMKHVGLALATTLSAALNAGLLFYNLVKMGGYQPNKRLLRYLIISCVGCFTMGLLLWFGSGNLSGWTSADLGARITRLLYLISSAIVLYFMIIIALGVRIKDFKNE